MLPSSFRQSQGHRRPQQTAKGKAKVTTYDRDIVCLPKSSPSQNGRYVIPRRDTRAQLGANGLIGKIRLSSDMLEADIMQEIRSVFSTPMGNDPQFPFSFLQRCGPGSNALTVPALSASFAWTAKEVVRLAGQGCIYILAGKDVTAPEIKRHHPAVSCHRHLAVDCMLRSPTVLSSFSRLQC